MAKTKDQQPPDISDAEKLRHYDVILELGKYADEKQKAYLADKETAKESKEEWEAAVCELQRAIKRANDPQQDLPFGTDGD